MGAAQIREELQVYIKKGDTRLLKILYAIAKGHNDEDYTLPGDAMSVETLKGRIRSAKTRIKSGQYTTREDLEKEVEKW